jgi:mono/diheme cytochrome c family protein
MRKGIWILILAVLILSIGVVGTVWAQELEGDPERGGELYVESCAVCHGINGQGRIGANLDSFPGIQVTSTLKQVIREGIEGSVMPAWSRDQGGPYTEQDIEDVVAYIVGAFGGTEPIAPAPTYVAPEIPPLPDIEGNPSEGSLVYQVNCVACHGEKGQGRFGLTLAKEWPGNQPDAFIRQVVRDGIPGTTMPAWAQENGGPLLEEEVEDVTAYILSLSPISGPVTPLPPEEGPIGRSAGLLILAGIGVLILLGLILYYRRA